MSIDFDFFNNFQFGAKVALAVKRVATFLLPRAAALEAAATAATSASAGARGALARCS